MPTRKIDRLFKQLVDCVSALWRHWMSWSKATVGGRCLSVPVAGRETGSGEHHCAMVSQAVVVAYAAHETGVYEVIALDNG